jgi:hypothetical protein
MGNTVESCRNTLESEISRWSGFAWALRKDDCKTFKELMDMCRRHASQTSNAANPIMFEPMVMSVLLAQQKRIMTIEKELGIKQKVHVIPEPKQI